jgi:hypothetical protein
VSISLLVRSLARIESLTYRIRSALSLLRWPSLYACCLAVYRRGFIHRLSSRIEWGRFRVAVGLYRQG